MIESVQTPARESVLAVLRNAAARTGSDFQYLLGTAMRESSLNANAQARTSSASGLFQFTGQTWLATIKAHGAEYGLSVYADAIHQTSSGRYVVDSPEMKDRILALRNDAQTSAFMAGEAAQDIREDLEGTLCRPVTCGELYAAHFLGEGGARKLIQANETDPAASAAAAFPDAAKANRNVFYHPDGSPKSIGEVYAWAVKLPDAAGNASTATATRAAPATPYAPMGDVAPGIEDLDDGNVAMTFPRSSGSVFAMPVPPAPFAAAGGPASALMLPGALVPGVIEILSGMVPASKDKPSDLAAERTSR